MFACRELFCAVCGGPFSSLDILDPSILSDDEQYQMDYSYDARVLPPNDTGWIEQFQMFGRVKAGWIPAIDEDRDEFVSSSVEWQYGFSFEPLIHYQTAEGSQRTIRLLAYTFFTAERDEILFPIHNACLILTRKKLASSRVYRQPKTLAELSIALGRRLLQCSHQVSRLERWPGYGESGGLEWEHDYFGARAFWADPWNCEEGAEWLCTDPLSRANVLDFFETCLSWPRALVSLSPRNHPRILATQPDSGIFLLPLEVLDIIADLLPLRSVLNFHSTCRRTAARLSPMDDVFWRSRTLTLFGTCFWELEDTEAVRLPGNWYGLLRVLTLARRAITVHEHKRSAAEEGSSHAKIVQEQRFMSNVLPEVPDSSGVKVPNSLLNRIRIWAILESVELDTTERSYN